MMVTVARRSKGIYEAYVNQASSNYYNVTVETEITVTDANTVLQEIIQFITKLKGKVTEYFTRTT